MSRRALHLTPALFGLLGLAGALALFLWQGIAPVMSALGAAGYGTVIAALAHFLPMSLNARAWQLLLPRRAQEGPRPTTLFFLWAVWLRESVNGLLPVARIGGEVASSRLLMRHGVGGPGAVASLVLDVTVSLGTQLLFAMLGIALLILEGHRLAPLRDLAAGALLIAPLIAIFVTVQKAGLFARVASLARHMFGDQRFRRMAGSAAALDRAVGDMYARRGAVIGCIFWQMMGWCAGGVEIWLALQFLGHPLPFADALIIESLMQILSSAAFAVPGALGVQEGGFLVVGAWVGLPHDAALALALMRRARDIMLFVPALLVWQSRWGLRLWRRRKPA